MHVVWQIELFVVGLVSSSEMVVCNCQHHRSYLKIMLNITLTLSLEMAIFVTPNIMRSVFEKIMGLVQLFGVRTVERWEQLCSQSSVVYE